MITQISFPDVARLVFKGLLRFRFLCLSLVVGGGLLSASPAMAQTLVPGDIAFTRMNLDASDGFSFVPLVTINAGTQINFTTFGWLGTTFNFGGNEAELTWTAPAGGVAAGTVVNIDEAGTANTFVTSAGSTVMNTGLSTAGGDNDRWDPRTAGDTILAYTGTSGFPSFIAGIAMEDNWNVDYWNPATEWAFPNPPYAGSITSSSLPAALTNGTTAVSVFPPSIPNGNGGISIERDNARYKAGVLNTGTRAQLLAAINNYQNWENDDTTAYSSPAVTSFTNSSASSTIIFNSTTGISGSQVTDGQGGSTDVPGISLQFSAKAANGTTDLPMTYQPHIYPGAHGIAGGYAANSIQSVFNIKSSSTATNFTMSSIFIVDYGGVDGDLLRIEAFDNGVSAGFITYQVSGAPWSDTVDLAGLGGTTFVDIDEVRITGNGGVDMYAAVNNVTISGITASASTATVTSLVRANATPTNLNTANWTLTFGSAVTGVTASHFTLGGTSTGASVGTPTTADAGLTWTVPVTTGTDGTLLLRLDNDTGLSSDVTTTLPFVGETYTVDKTAPDTSITATPALLTTSTSANFSYTGSDTGSGVASYQVKLDAASFATGTSPTAYTSLVDGSHTFQVRAVDAAGNVDASPASYTWVVDTTPPQVLSVTRLSPTGQAVSATTVTFRVTYSEAVTLNAPAAARYAVVPVGGSSITGTVTGVSGTGATRDVAVSITGGTGEFRLRVVD